MSPEDRLDALLDGAAPTPEDADLQPLLSASARLRPLRNAQPSTAFAARLEARLMDYAAELSPPDAPTLLDAPRPPLVYDLNDAPTLPGTWRAGTEYAQGAAPVWPSPASAPRPLSARTSSPAAHRSLSWMWRGVAAAAVLLVVGTSLLAAVASAAPGSPFYALRQMVQSRGATPAATQTPSDPASARIARAASALDALDAVASTGGDAYQQALARFRQEFASARAMVAQTPAGRQHDALAGQLAALQSRAQTDLRTALSRLDWPARLETTAALGELGVTVPVIAQAEISGAPPAEDGQGRAETPAVVKVDGTGIQNGATLLVNGQPATCEITKSEGNELIAQCDWDGLTQSGISIGISNPDGTAAATTNVESHVSGNQGDGQGDDKGHKGKSAMPDR